MDTVLVITFGAVTLVAGLTVYWVSVGHKLSPYLALREIMINWRELLGQGPGEMPVVNTDALGYQALVKHFPGYYWADDRPVTGSAGRVYVYPDFIARLHYVNHWEHCRLLDASAFCLRVGEMGDTASNTGWSVVDFLCRGVRWQLSFDDSSMKSQDKYIMNCHLAVHTAVNLPLSEADRLDRLFDIRPQFEQVLRSVISGVLRDELSKRRYREAMYAVPEIIEQLNRQWAERPEFRDYRDLIRVHFSALVIRPRVEAERQFITADVNLANVKEKIRSLVRKVEENRDRRRHRWEEWMCKQEEAMTALAGRAGDDDDDGQVDGQVDSSIKQAADALRDQMTFIGNAPPLLESVGALFTTGLVDLENCTREVLERIKDLARLMEEVRVDYENLLRDIRALESSPAKQGGQDSGEALRPANSPELLVHLPTVNEVVP